MLDGYKSVSDEEESDDPVPVSLLAISLFFLFVRLNCIFLFFPTELFSMD